MINFAIRYRPILQELQRRQPNQLLEVGSGPEGIALFWRGRVVGADVAFKRPPLHTALQSSILALPFASDSWQLVLSCDTLEHISPDQRQSAVNELARVAGETLFLAFPSGEAAQRCYAELAQRLPEPLPGWLREHLLYALPDAQLVAGWLRQAGWSVKTRWHESASAHQRLMRWESRRPVQLLTYGLMRLAGPWVAARWPVEEGGPFLRALLIAEKIADPLRVPHRHNQNIALDREIL